MKYFNLKFLTFFLTALLAFGVGWAETAGFSLASGYTQPPIEYSIQNQNNASGTITGIQEETWNVLINPLTASSMQGATDARYWQMGKKDFPIEFATFSTNDISGRITKIVVNCASYNAIGSISATVDGNSFGTQNQSIPKWSNNAGGDVTFEGEASGAITITMTNTSSGRAMYIQSITVTYEENTTPSTDPTIKVGSSELDINQDGGSFTVKGRNLIDNIGVTPSTGFSTIPDPKPSENEYWGFVNNNGSVDGTVTVNYVGRLLNASGTVTMGTKPYVGASNDEDITEVVNVNFQYDGDIYIVGDINGLAWGTSGGKIVGVQMDKNADGTYEKTITANANNNGECWLYFTKTLDVATYDDLGKNNFGPIAGWTYSDATNGVFGNLETADQINTIQLTPGSDYTIVVDPANNQFKITKVTGPVTYEKVNSTEDVTDGNYLIVYEMGATGLAFDGSRAKLDDTSNNQEVTITDEKITTSDAIYFTYDASAKTLKSASGYYIGNNSNSNGLSRSESAVLTNTITIDNDGNAVISALQSGGTYNNYTTLRFNSASNQSRFRYYTSGQQAIQLYKEVNTNKVATPKFTPAAGTYTEVQEVTISCATDGATIYYSTDGTNWTPGTTVNVTESCTLYAKATKDGMEPSAIATAVYTINLPEQVDNIAAVNALDPDKNFVFNNKAVVVHRKGHQMWIQDYNPTAGGALVYGEDLAFNDNDVLKTGWTGTTATYNGKKEIINLHAETDGTKEAVAMKRTTLSENNINEYVLLENVALNIVEGDTIITLPDSKGNVKVYDNFKKLTEFNLTEGFNYNVKGIVDIYTKNNTSTLEIYPLSIELVKKDLTLGFDPASVEIYVGETFTAPALTGVPEGETINVAYSSDNTALATVTNNVVSLVEGATGTATITANFAGNDLYNSATATYTITVNEKLAHGMSFSAETLNVTYGDEDYEAPTLNNPNSLTVTYESDNEDVAVVDENTGELLLGDAGTAVITAKTKGDASHNGGSVSYTVNIAKAAAGLAYETAQYTVYAGQDFEAPTLTNPNKLTVTYESSNEDVALVDETGDVLIGEKVGDAKITAKFEGNKNYEAGSASYTIHVIAKDNVTMSFDPTSVTLYVDEEFAQPTLTTNPANLPVKYSSDNEEVAMVDETSGEVLLMEKAGTATITAKYAGNDQYNEASATYTITVENRPEILIDDESLDLGTTGEGEIFVMASDLKENVTVTSSNENFKVEPPTITPEQAANGVNVTVTYTGNNPEGESTTITFSTKDGEDVKVTVTAKAETYVDIAKPTFSPKAGTYTEPKKVAIACATPGVTIEYTIDGVTKTYEGPFLVENNCTVTATAKMGTRTVYTPATSSATYTINAAPAATIADDYYFLQSNAAEVSGKYANVAGRRTLNFVADADKQAGTVFRVMTDPDTIGQVETLRSQAVDLQGYANRAMAYVPKVIDLVLSTLANSSLGDPETPGTGILGENGLDLILNKFYEGFDYNLYVEEGTEGTYRIYGRTPSMQHVVDFYHENTAQVEEKLPMLEGYINQVLDKIRNKVGQAGMNEGAIPEFSLKTVRDSIAKKNGIALIDPVDNDSKMEFYRQVLNNKEYVWDFAYQTAMIYVDAIKQTGTYQNLPNEYKRYVEKMEKVRPDTKYYIIERGNELDYISENNGDIISNDPRTFWTLTKRPYFTVNFPEENKYGSKLVTTLYTDFAYDVPEDVTAYKVTDIDANGFATIADLGKNVPAQTPVLLMTDATAKATTKNVTLNTTDGTRPNGNLLEGPDYLINKYKITSPTVEALFAIAAGIVGGEESDAYQTYVKPYEYLKLRTSGTVNNRYFWGLNSDDLKKCSEKNSEDKLDCVVRSLGVNDEGKDIGFYRNREALLANQAFIPNIEFNPILLEVVATPTFDPKAGTYNEAQTVTIACETEGATIYYKMGDEENWTKYDPEQPINVAQTTTIQAYAVKDGLGDSEIAEATYTIELPAEAPTFNPVPGSYEEAQDVTIIAPEGATVSYRIDGGEWQTYTEGEEIHVDATQTIEAKVVMEGMSESAVATGYYVIDIPEALPTNMPVFDGYYSILNSGKYANVQGRKTLTFTTEPDAQAGTVIRLKSDNTGKVEVLRSQAADLQRYAYRALDYVPDIVQIVVDKLGAEGEGHILGQEGLDAIMDKFDKSFKPDLYIEKAGENGYRIYGKTPSMQPVVDFYRENKDKVEAKLPDLVAFINSALAKLRAKAEQAGMNGDNVFVDFDLKTIWERMGGNLTDPEVDEMGFYRDVLNYKDNVWNFAYQTATFYLEKIKNTGTYESLLDELGEYAQYLDKIDQIHPDFKYYIVANEGVTKPDFISEGNTDIANDAARTIWTIEPRENFTVNFPEENKLGDEYVTTLYTDFAYTLPEGVTAWAVESVNEQGIAKLAKVDDTTIAAQTPVLLKSTTAGDVVTFGITTAEGTVPATNELVGPDYLIETYQIKTPEVVKLFEAIKSVLGENIYNDLVEDYGHLQLRNSGTVNNKYFWGLNEEEVKSCAKTNPETGKLVKVVRSLGIKDDILGFNDNEHVYTNKALLVSTEHSAITFSLRGDINRDGQITIADVTALIDILLELPAEPYHEASETYPKGLDYEAADFNENGDITIHDVSALIDYLLGV